MLPREFFARPVTSVAIELLGCVLLHETGAGLVAVLVTEVEAYAGQDDPASHAFRGKTARNAVMFGEPGHAYVYFTYGMHFCMNLVCGPAEQAAAVLLRAGRIIAGQELAAARRSGQDRGSGQDRAAARRSGPGAVAASGAAGVRGAAAGIREVDLARGPARLCRALGIDRLMDGADVCDSASPLRIFGPPDPGAPSVCQVEGGQMGGGQVEGSQQTGASQVDCGPRVGVSRGAEVAWRFWIAGDRTVSAYRAHVPRGGAGGPRPSPAGPPAASSIKSVASTQPADGSMHR